MKVCGNWIETVRDFRLHTRQPQTRYSADPVRIFSYALSPYSQEQLSKVFHFQPIKLDGTISASAQQITGYRGCSRPGGSRYSPWPCDRGDGLFEGDRAAFRSCYHAVREDIWMDPKSQLSAWQQLYLLASLRRDFAALWPLTDWDQTMGLLPSRQEYAHFAFTRSEQDESGDGASNETPLGLRQAVKLEDPSSDSVVELTIPVPQ